MEMKQKIEQMMERLLTEIRTNKAKKDANNKKVEVLPDTLTSWVDIHQARPESNLEERKAKINIHQDKTEAAIHSILSELDVTIKHRVEDVLLCINLKRQASRRN
jgi:hypothetical protein